MVNQRFVFKNSGISCLALKFNLNNPSTTVLNAKKSVHLCDCIQGIRLRAVNFDVLNSVHVYAIDVILVNELVLLLVCALVLILVQQRFGHMTLPGAK